MAKNGLFTANHNLKILPVLLNIWVNILTEWLYPISALLALKMIWFLLDGGTTKITINLR